MIVFICCVAFLLRVFPRLFRPSVLSSDTYFHLSYARAIRENGFRPPRRMPRILLSPRVDYPFLYHLLLSLFPERLRLDFERMSGALFDTLTILVAYRFSVWAVETWPGPGLSTLPIWVAALLAVSPSLLRLGSGPRAYGGTERVPAQTWYVLHVTAAFVAWTRGDEWALAVCLLAGAATILTAKFGHQVVWLFGAVLGAAVSWRFPVLAAASLGLAFALTGGWANRMIRGQIAHLRYYFTTLQKIFLYPHIVPWREYGRRIRAAGTMIGNGEWMGFLRWLLVHEQHPAHLLLTVNPQFVVLLFAAPALGGSSLDRFMMAWAAAGFGCFIMTKTRPMLFLGEGERYLEYAVFPSVFLSVKGLLLLNAGVVLWGWLTISCAMALFYFSTFLESYADEGDAAAQLFDVLGQLPVGVVWPIAWYHWMSLFRSRLPILAWIGIQHETCPPEQFTLVYGNYPYPSSDFEGIIARYGVSYVVTSRPCLTHYLSAIVDQPARFAGWVEEAWQAGTLILLKLIASPDTPRPAGPHPSHDASPASAPLAGASHAWSGPVDRRHISGGAGSQPIRLGSLIRKLRPAELIPGPQPADSVPPSPPPIDSQIPAAATRRSDSRSEERHEHLLVQMARTVVPGVVGQSRRDITVFGAGEVGRALAEALNWHGVRVSHFVDNDQTKWHTQIDGVAVVSLEEAVRLGLDGFAVGSLASATAIRQAIVSAYRSTGRIPAIFGPDCRVGPAADPDRDAIDTSHDAQQPLCAQNRK